MSTAAYRRLFKKERHKQYRIPFAPPPPGPGCFRLRASPRDAVSGPPVGPYQWRVRFSCTSAFDRRRRRKAPSFTNSRPPCLCLGQKRNPAPEIQYIINLRRVNAKKRPERHFPRHKRVFFRHGQVCCTGFVLPCRDSGRFELRIGIRFLFPEK